MSGCGRGVWWIALGGFCAVLLMGCEDIGVRSAVAECAGVCPESSECVQGACACIDGTLCDGECVDVQNNPARCGDCDVVCSDGEQCVAGECQCLEGTELCEGACVELGSTSHCGTCGDVCDPGAICDEGECRCPVGSSECEGVCAELAWDESHCGACGQTCGQGELCCDGLCAQACPCEQVHRDRSNLGCEFWAAELDNRKLLTDPTATPDAPFAVVLFNPGQETARVTVYGAQGEVQDALSTVEVRSTILGDAAEVHTALLDGSGGVQGDPIEGPLDGVEVPGGALLQILLPRKQPEVDVSSIEFLGWRVLSDVPVVAYQFNPICCNFSFTNDATLLLPVGALGLRYRALGFPHWSREETGFEGPATLTVAAPRDDTQVEIRLAGVPIHPGARVPFPDPNGTVRVRMRAGEVLTLQTRAGEGVEPDLTGVELIASKPVSVFSGHVCTFVPRGDSACDHLEHQLIGVESWGRRAVATPLALRGRPEVTEEGVFWKFVAERDGTVITLSALLDELATLAPGAPGSGVEDCRARGMDSVSFVLDAGQSCELGTRAPFAVESSGPFLMGGFLSGQDSTGGGVRVGDPSFFLVPPREQFRSEYAFLTPSTYALDYVTAVIEDGAGLVLDDEPVDLDGVEVEQISGVGLWVVHLPVEDGPHTLRSEAPFGLVVYAYDQFVSYAYTGGLDLAIINP